MSSLIISIINKLDTLLYPPSAAMKAPPLSKPKWLLEKPKPLKNSFILFLMEIMVLLLKKSYKAEAQCRKKKQKQNKTKLFKLNKDSFFFLTELFTKFFL